MKYLLTVLLLMFALIGLSGCGTPEGGSSLPWSQPESWESGSTALGLPY